MQTSPDQSATATASQSPSAGRRLLSKFASGLPTKPRSVAEFFIELDENHRQYSNGDVVKGSVRLRVLKPVRITHLVVTLSGHALAYKNPATPGDTPKIPATQAVAGKGRASSGQYHGNGYATLFEDEAILCGDGRLAEGSYQFNFELVFPKKDLPSSIDFERGRISYAITATLTRPTTMTPVISYDRNVMFTERIDISSLTVPKPRTVTLDPVTKRSKARSQALKLIDQPDRKSQLHRRSTSKETLTMINTNTTTNTNNTATTANTTDSTNLTAERPSESSAEAERPLSPVPSELSAESLVSSNGLPSQNGSISISPTASVTPRKVPSKSGAGKAISTIIAPCAGGCLRGDHLAVKITVKHTKYMRSMNGIIVTLYRHARVDTQPVLSVGPLDGANKEDSFKKSYTGLGGLSLSGAGPAHVFRKDMAQVILPLVINPSTLTAEMVAKLRVPEEAFPTIVGVPGSMISFRYHLEVIVDIQGRLSAPDRGSASLGELTGLQGGVADPSEGDWSATTNYGTRILDTSYIRRDQGLVCMPFEVVIGTVDTERRKGKQKAEVVKAVERNGHQPEAAQQAPSHSQLREEEQQQSEPQHVPSDPPAFDSIRPTPAYDSQLHDGFGMGSPSSRINGYLDHHGNGHRVATTMTPPPSLPDESQMSEKERIRLAETRLLPSQPPGLDDELPVFTQASAPRLDGTDVVPSTEQGYAEAGPSNAAGDVGEALERYPTTTHAPVDGQASHSANASSSTVIEDKQELERARLQAQASSPPDDVDETPDGAARASGPTYHATEPDLHDSHADASGSADLPRYER